MIRHHGTGRDNASPLDWTYRPHSPLVRRLPEVVDLRRPCPPVCDQLRVNSGSANSCGARWGNHGYGFLPYACIASPDVTRDCWTMRRVS